MKRKETRIGLTIVETLVVIGIIALFVGFTMPAIPALLDSLESGAGTESMISAAMATARSLAAKEGCSIGIRFQKSFSSSKSDPLDAPQYMIFIRRDRTTTAGGDFNRFQAMAGRKPIRLPRSVGAMDLRLGFADDIKISDDLDFIEVLNRRVAVWDTTTFSILFSPNGKLVVRKVKVVNRNSEDRVFLDDIFNTWDEITRPNNPHGMFLEDDYAGYGFTEEYSRRNFLIYNQNKFKRAYKHDSPYTDYLIQLIPQKISYINIYMGTLITKD